MKKTLLFLLAVLGTTSLASVNLRVGVDTYSKSKAIGPYSDGSTENVGYEIGAEYMLDFIPLVKLGAGISYQNHAKFSGNDTDWNIGNFKENYKGYDDFKSFDSVPLYLTAKITPLPFFPFNPYIKLNLGYSFNFGNGDIRYSQGSKDDDDYYPGLSLPQLDPKSCTSSTKISNGVYYGIGVGAEFLMLGVELMYQSNIAQLTVDDKENGSKKYDVNYDRVSLILNLKF